MLALASLALLVGSAIASPPWTKLNIKWDLIPFQGGFDDVTGWLGDSDSSLVDHFCPGNAESNRYFSFVDPNATFLSPFTLSKTTKDKTIVVLYDTKTQIAGLQNWVPASSGFQPGDGEMANFYVKVANKQSGEQFFVQTVYFEDPATICTGGRSDGSVTGTGLWFQNGPDPLHDYFHAPMSQSVIDAMPEFHNTGVCFPTMGMHYWRNVRSDMQCKDMNPYCLLYNEGNLDAFCFASNAKYSDSELDSPKPTYKVLNKFMKTVPTCMNKDNTAWNSFSTVHVYLTAHPKFNFC